ncbi:MAG TPA: hypothetical protein VGD66_03640 [Allosphingosinicella sp.]|jgi:hypothetical protein
MSRPAFTAVLAALALAGCGGSSPADNAADRLDRAADQSTPEAANVLDTAADRIRDGNGADANAQAQQALQAAGNAQAAARGSAPAPQGAPPQVGAKPHAAGDPVPPPKLPAGKGAPGGKAPTGDEG